MRHPQTLLIAALRTTASFLFLGFLASGGQAMASQAAVPGGSPAGQSATPRKWAWPLPGVDGSDWVINNYVDIDPGSGIRDYMGGSKSYNGHKGIDIDVPNFRAMDEDFPVRSVERGMVVALDDVHFDRNTSCTGQWNFVTVQHQSGLRTTYGHLKQNSVVVSVGQSVARGQTLAVVGSSGCSTYPHLHLETRDEMDAVVDPFGLDLFQAPPVYDTPLSFMDAVITEGNVNGIPEIADPGPNATVLGFGDSLGVGLSMAGGGVGDQVQVRVRRPDGTLYTQHTIPFSTVYRHSLWIRNFNLSSTIGTWNVEVLTNGQVAETYPVAVGPPVNTPRITRFKVNESDYQAEFNFYVGQGYRPVWFDGYDSSGTTYFNVIFEQTAPVGWYAFHNMTASSFDNWHSTFVGSSFRVTHVESYLLNGSVRYAMLAENSPGPDWVAYRTYSDSAHQSTFGTLANQGFHTTATSALNVGGVNNVTALYENDNVGGWSHYYGMDGAGYQSLYTSEAAAGRYLSYVNTYRHNGVTRYAAIWNSITPNQLQGVHGTSLSGLNSTHATLEAQGYDLRFVTGSGGGSSDVFAACWKK